MSYEEILKSIKQKKFSPVYYFYGEEDYFIDNLAEALEQNVLTEAEKSFNQNIVYGKDLTPQSLIEICNRLPMGAERQLVLVREAQSFQIKADDEKIEKLLLHYFKHPQKTTILAFAHKHGSPDKRKKIYKELLANSVSFQSDKIREGKAGPFIVKFLEEKDFSIEHDAVNLLEEFVGTDMTVITNELSKLIITAPPGKTFTAKDIEKSVGLLKEFSVFELNNVIGAKNLSKAYRIANYFKANPKSGPLVLVVSSLFSYFNKLYICACNMSMADAQLAPLIGSPPFYVKDYKAAVRNYPLSKIEKVFYLLNEYDLRSKGVDNYGTTEGELIREMVYKIIHA
jgi:DNA polymerase III subunit delta